MMIYFILIVNALLAFKLVHDYIIRTKKHRVINHKRSVIIDGVIYVAAAYFFIGVNYTAALYLAVAIIYRGLVFDLLYNLIFKNKFSYCGDNSGVDQWADTIDGKDDQNCTAWFIIKLVGMAVVITLIIIL